MEKGNVRFTYFFRAGAPILLFKVAIRHFGVFVWQAVLALAMRSSPVLVTRPKQLGSRHVLRFYTEKKHLEFRGSYLPAHPVLNIRLSLHNVRRWLVPHSTVKVATCTYHSSGSSSSSACSGFSCSFSSVSIIFEGSGSLSDDCDDPIVPVLCRMSCELESGLRGFT